MEAIQAFLEAVKQGGKQSHLNMTLIPLLAPDAGEPDYPKLVRFVCPGRSLRPLRLRVRKAFRLVRFLLI
jgi:hypothetical protein